MVDGPTKIPYLFAAKQLYLWFPKHPALAKPPIQCSTYPPPYNECSTFAAFSSTDPTTNLPCVQIRLMSSGMRPILLNLSSPGLMILIWFFWGKSFFISFLKYLRILYVLLSLHSVNHPHKVKLVQKPYSTYPFRFILYGSPVFFDEGGGTPTTYLSS